jgi:hypothetical protein
MELLKHDARLSPSHSQVFSEIVLFLIPRRTRRRSDAWQLQAYRTSAALLTVLNATLCY